MNNTLKCIFPFGFLSAIAMAIPPAEPPFVFPSDLPPAIYSLPNAGGPYYISFGSSVELDGSASSPAYVAYPYFGPPSDSDPSYSPYFYLPSEIVSYKWDIGVDGTVDFDSSNSITLVDYDYLFSHGFNVGVGSVIPVSLSVSSLDEGLNAAVSQATITVIPEPSSAITSVVLSLGVLFITKIRSRTKRYSE
jgi:hypothetical protein